MSAAILLNSLGWLPVAATLAIAAAAFLFWSYKTSRIRGKWRWICVALKGLSIIALALCLLEPLWVTQRSRSGANFFLLLADNSRSLEIQDQGSSESRGQSLKRTLNEDGIEWQAQLAKDFQLRRYLFDSRLTRVETFSKLDFEGRSSGLHSALTGIKERFNGQPLAGVLLFSDGNATDLPGPEFTTNGLPPIHVVMSGWDAPARDVAIASVAVTQTAFEDAPVTAQAELMAYGCAGEPIVARLLDRSGKVVAEQSATASEAEARITLRFQFKPVDPGLSYYQIKAAARSDWDQFSTNAAQREATLWNNSRMLVVDRGQEPFRVLYVSGRPNWEYKFLNRAIQEDAQVQMVALIRVARREPKFSFRGRSGETSNPLFRGFGNQDKEVVESYDQPVLVRLNTRDQAELQGGFPKTAEELFSYHAVIVDDLEAEFFTPAQMQLLQKFVSLRGGGFLMLGGRESFQQGRYQRTPVGDLLPVYLDRAIAAPPSTNNLKLSLTREGMLQPWVRLRMQESDEKLRLDAMPGFQVINRVRDFKPGATVLATVTDDRKDSYPAVVMQRYGNGRTGAVLVGDVWRWGMQSPELRQDMEKAWRQIVRWLVSDVPMRLDVQSEPLPGDPNQAVRIQVRSRDKAFQPIDNARVSLEVTPIGMTGSNTPIVRIEAEASPTEPGLYEATYVPRSNGAFEARAEVVGADGALGGKAATGWVSDSGAEEFQALKPNRGLLENLARATGGSLLARDDIPRFVKDLPNRQAPIMETASVPLWHRSLVFLIALALFIAEWGIRRWKGLA